MKLSFIFILTMGLQLFSSPVLFSENSATPTATEQKKNPLGPITAHAEVSKGFITVGEPVEFKISVRFAKDVEILDAIGEPTFTGLEMKSSKDWEDHEGKYTILGKTFTLSGFELGNFLIEPIEISYRIQSGPPQIIKTNPTYITIKSISEGENKEDIRDVKGVVKLPYKILKYLLWMGIPTLVFILLALYLLYFRKCANETDRNAENLSPAEQALRDLHELFESSLIREGKVKQYYLRFSEIQKTFLEKQFGIQATEATTSEIARLMKRIPLTDESRQHLIAVLEAADFAKFAKWIPTPADILSFNSEAETVIRELSTPVNQGTEPHAVS